MRPTPQLTQAERTEISDARMLEAAINLIVEHGAAAMTLKDVGELAGYSRGLAGYRFGNKAGLLEFVIRSIAEEWKQEVRRVTARLVGYDAIVAVLDAHYRVCADAPDHLVAFYMLWFESLQPQSELKKVVSGMHERRCEDVMSWIREGIEAGLIDPGVDLDAVVGQFHTTCIGINYQWLLDPKDVVGARQLYENLKRTMRLWLEIDDSQR